MRLPLLVLVVLGALGRSAGAERRPDLNAYIVRAVIELNAEFGHRGYVHGGVFTHDLDWRAAGEIPASKYEPKTMCVAAVTEVLATALAMYVRETGDKSVYDRVPARRWYKTTREDLRPYLFLFSSVSSNGTADALSQFGMGVETPFADLRPGDFINLNRTRTGHAVVFLEFIDKNAAPVTVYDKKSVVGFKYFSSQGTETNGGLGYRWAFFEGSCPSKPIAGKPQDCGVIWSTKQKYLNTGYLLHPNEWTVGQAVYNRTMRARSEILGRPLRGGDLQKLPPNQRVTLEREVARRLSAELPDTTPINYDGTTD